MDVRVVDRLVEASRFTAQAQAAELVLIHEIAHTATQPEFAAIEVACALTLTRFAAEDMVRLAAELCDRLPDVLSTLSKGDISLAKARVFADVLAVLDVEPARRVAALVLPKAPFRTTGQLREMLRRKALAADPAFSAARRERSSLRRSVELHTDNDGTASLTAFGLDATRSAAAMQRVGQIALARKLEGDIASLDQLRADVLLELLEGKHEGTTRGVINLSVSLETLARWNNDPGTLGAFGPVAADIARQWIEQHPGYQWTYAIRDLDASLLQQGLTRARAMNTNQPVSEPGTATSEIVDAAHEAKPDAPRASLTRPPVQGPKDRLPNAAMTRWIRLRDKTCQAPGCRMPAWQSDIDHNQRYTDGGLTTHDNLCALCRHHHRAKEEGGWRVVQTRPGHFVWISPLGRVYEVGPEPP